MIGDSVTDCGRTQPVAEGLFDPLGRGYVTMVEALLTSTYPDRGIRVVNVGTSGNTVRDLKARWDRDVLGLKPDWLSVCIGINDVWRQFDLPRIAEAHVGLKEYETTLDGLLSAVRPRLKGLVLMTPYHIEANRRDAMRKRMDQYGAVIRRLAARYDATCVDTQAAFDGMLRHMHSAAIAWDRVHPNQVGHMLLARSFLNAVGFEWPR
jgi:lysophospholipase L1-like esterase